MFPTRYFGDRAFAPRFFPKVGADPVAPPPGGKSTVHVQVTGNFGSK